MEWVAPGLEVVQSIYPAWQFTTEDSIINGGMHGCLVLGERISTIESPQLLDGLPEMAVSLCRDGVEVESGRGANALDVAGFPHFNVAQSNFMLGPVVMAALVAFAGPSRQERPFRVLVFHPLAIRFVA